jgi:hypothetical protein
MRRLSTLLVVAVAATACDEGRTSVVEPYGDIAIGAAVGPAAANLPGGTVTVASNVATLRLANLRNGSLGYHFWYVARDVAGVDVYTLAYGRILEFYMRDSLTNGDTGDPVVDLFTGRVIQVRDTNVVSDVRTNRYPGTDQLSVFEVQVVLDSAADVGTTTPALGRNAVVVSVGSGTTADGMILFRRTGVAGNGALLLGRFGGTDIVSATNPTDYVFTVGGTGTVAFRGPEVAATLRELRRPPQGFFYRGYLVDTAGTATEVDTLRSAYSAIGAQSRVSMFDADVNALLPGIAVTAITHSTLRNCAAGAAIPGCGNSIDLPSDRLFGGQELFIVTLDPKGAANTLGKTVILSAAIPDRVWGDDDN